MGAFNPISDTSIGIIGLIVTYVLSPFSKEARAHLKTRRAMRTWLYGIKGVAGISVDQLSAPEQFMAMQSDIKDIRIDQGKVMTAVGTLIDIARSTDQGVRAVDKKITPNGQETNALGDTVARMAKSSGNWLDNPKE